MFEPSYAADRDGEGEGRQLTKEDIAPFIEESCLDSYLVVVDGKLAPHLSSMQASGNAIKGVLACSLSSEAALASHNEADLSLLQEALRYLPG